MTIEKTIDTQIEELIRQLGAASNKESERIHNRLDELKALKKEHATT